MDLNILSSSEKEAVSLFRQKLQELFGQRLKGLKLFGSCVRGERWEESDIDLLVLIEALSWQEKKRVWDEAADVNLSCGTLLSPLVLRPEEYQKLFERERRIALDIEREGIPL